MTLSFLKAVRPLSGVRSLPGDKSLAHRAALFAALAEGDSDVSNYPDSGVTRAMRQALATLGVPSTLEDGVLRLSGNGLRAFPRAGETVYCGNSGTTFRLLAGALVATGTAAVLDGSDGLRRRPMDRIAEPLRLMGAAIDTTDGHAPLTIRPAPLHGITYHVPVASAQVLSCLQLAALGAGTPCVFTTPGPVRDHTERMLREMGGRPPFKPLRGVLPGDLSSAAFLLVAAAIVPGSRVTLTHVGLNPTRTGILDILSAMGARIVRTHVAETFGEPVGDLTLEAAPLHGVDVSGDLVVRTIDEFPALAVAAACADGITTVRDATELRYKESDRIAALVSQLSALGVEISETPDGFAIRGGTLRGGTVRAGGDHRLAMSMALCGLVAPDPVLVEDAEILTESFPSFVPSLTALGAVTRA